MPPIERDAAPWDVERVLRHQHSSSSDQSRSLVPMWDSSDPERAPPPLPLNPQSPSVGASRPGTSSAIQSAHAALTEKARENALVSTVLAKRIGEGSPERSSRHSSSRSTSLVRTDSTSTPRHRRMQSQQLTSVRDRSLLLENGGAAASYYRDALAQSPNTQSPEKTKTTAITDSDPFVDDPVQQRTPTQQSLSNTDPGPSLTPIVRPVVRRPHQQSILGENTPPKSATMLALHDMATASGSISHSQRDPAPLPVPPPSKACKHTEQTWPLANVTNSPAGPAKPPSATASASLSKPATASTMAVVRQPTVSVENLSKQILSLTNIATGLQKEMSQLSRRSRDNATDLLSLKQATNTRDEDIRKSLRELITSSSEIASTRSRDSYPGVGPFLIDNKPHGTHLTSPLSKSVRPFSLPRIPSPNSFAASLSSVDRDSMSTPSLYGGAGSDGANTLALLERIVRDMGTKEGQSLLLNRLAEVTDKLSGMASAAKLEELIRLIKERQEQVGFPTSSDRSVADGDSRGMGGMGDGGRGGGRSRTFSFDDESPSRLEIEYNRKGPTTLRAERLLQSSGMDQRRSSAPPTGPATDVINDDMIKIIKSVKDSVAQGGGLTAEVKALVRELRGEVLGMGREIGRRLDEVESRVKEEGKPDVDLQAEMAKVVEEGLEEMKQHMSNLMREHRRQSATSVAAAAAAAAQATPTIDYQEVYNSMRTALKDSQASKPRSPELSREDVIEAVKDAWETYKPEIEVQQIGLERDEVLACLEEGLREYIPRERQPSGATRDEVFQAIVEGLKHFVSPQMPAASMSRDEVLGAVRECLEEFEFPVAPSAMGAEMTKEDMVDAVKQGLNGFDFPQTVSSDRELLLRDDEVHMNSGEIVRRLEDIMQCMRDEFKAVSDEAKQNVAASGRDTEQVLDATRDGLEKLRADLEAYVDKVAAAVTHVDFSEGLIRTLDVFRDEIAELVSKASDAPREVLKEEIEALRETVNSSMIPAIPTPAVAPAVASNREVLEALQEGVSLLRSEISNRHVTSTSEVLDAIQEGLTDLRISIDKLSNKPTDLTANDEILDALKAGLGDVRSEIDGLRDQSSAVAPLDSSTAVVPADMLRHDDIKNLESLISQLRSKVEVLDATQAKAATEDDTTSRAIAVPDMWQEKIEAMESKLHAIHASVVNTNTAREATSSDAGADTESNTASDTASDTASKPKTRPSTDAASREDVEAIETILRNTKARLDDLIDGEPLVRKEHLDALESLVQETKASVGGLATQLNGLSSREDVRMVESLVAHVSQGFDEMKERHEKQLEDPDKVMKTDVDAVALACLQVKSAVEKMAEAEDKSGLPSKDDLLALTVIVRDIRTQVETESEVVAKASEDNQAAMTGVRERVSDVKAFLEELNETVKTRLEDGVLGIESVGKVLDALSDTIGQNSSDLHDLYETMRTEFEESRAGAVGASEVMEAKLEERVGELVAQCEAFQMAADEAAKSGEARQADMEAAVVGTKTIADELKLLVDTLGSAVTDSMEKMEEASKTVFTRVDEMAGRAEENHSEGKAEHEQTREHVQETLSAVQGVQSQVVEYQPKILDTLKDVLLVVSEHYEHSKSSNATIQEKIVEAKAPEQPLLPPVEQYDDSSVQEKLDKLVGETDRTALALHKLDQMDRLVDDTRAMGEALTKLDRLVEHAEGADKALGGLDKLEKLEKLDYLVVQADTTSQTLSDLEKLTKLDQIIDLSNVAGRAFDTQHAKIDRLLDHVGGTREKLDKLDKLDQLDQLDTLVDHAHSTDKALAQLGSLDEVHAKVVQMAAELSQYMETQRQRIADEHEDHERTLQETLLALERRQAEKEQVGASVMSLRDEEQQLKESVARLRAEQDGMVRSKTRLTAEVSSLETALRLRREELQEMEARAEGLERRILDGVMDQSRVLLMAKASKNGRDAMNRKRVVPAKTTKTEAKPRGAFHLAMAAKRALLPTNSPGGVSANGTPGGSRRILSLSQINSSSSSGSLQRSHSVRANVGGSGLRKSSWGGRMATGKGLDVQDKENAPAVLKESDEEEDEDEDEVEGGRAGFQTPLDGRVSTPMALSTMVPYRRRGGDAYSDAECGGGSDDEAGTLRRSSMGTSLGGGTPSETEEYNSGAGEDYDVMSQWTSSLVDGGSTVSTVPGSMVLYGSEL